MTDDDSTSCERTTLQDQDIEKFSCNRHVLVTLFKTFTVAPSRTEKAPWQGLLTRLRGVGLQGLEPLNMDVFNRFVFAILMQVIRLVCLQKPVDVFEGLDIGDFHRGYPRVSLAMRQKIRSLEIPWNHRHRGQTAGNSADRPSGPVVTHSDAVTDFLTGWCGRCHCEDSAGGVW